MRNRSVEPGMTSRAALFGGSGATAAIGRHHIKATLAHLVQSRLPGQNASNMRDVLEEDNDRLISDLERKVAALKYATQSVHDEVHAEKRLLNSLGDDFSSTSALMSSTLTRLDGLLKYAGGGSHTCALIGFVVAVFVLLWYLTSRS